MNNTHTHTQRRLRLTREITIYITVALCSIYLAITSIRLMELVEGGHYTILLALLFQIVNTALVIGVGYILEHSRAYTISNKTYNKLLKVLSIMDKVLTIIELVVLLPIYIIYSITSFILKPNKKVKTNNKRKLKRA